MATSLVPQQTIPESWADEEIVSRVLAGETDLFAIIMRRHSTRLYRVALSVVRDDAEAEDVMEEAFVRAYQHLGQFAGRAKFATWLTRIVVNEALMRNRRRSHFQSFDPETDADWIADNVVSTAPDPEETLSQKELTAALESAILALPDHYRTVLIMRDVQDLSVAETAECLGLTEENVKIRLYRARAALRRAWERSGADLRRTFVCPVARCDRLAKSVLARIYMLTMVPSLRA